MGEGRGEGHRVGHWGLFVCCHALKCTPRMHCTKRQAGRQLVAGTGGCLTPHPNPRCLTPPHPNPRCLTHPHSNPRGLTHPHPKPATKKKIPDRTAPHHTPFFPQKCPLCGQKPEHPALCLVTGRMTCSWWRGCVEGVSHGSVAGLLGWWLVGWLAGCLVGWCVCLLACLMGGWVGGWHGSG